MAPEEIPADVRALLRDRITSFEALEVVLLLRAQPQRSWSAQELAEWLRVAEEDIARALQRLKAGALIVAEAGGSLQYRYGPATTELARAVHDLARMFEEQRPVVMSIMSANAIERVRMGALQTFGDAFIIRKKDHDG